MLLEEERFTQQVNRIDSYGLTHFMRRYLSSHKVKESDLRRMEEGLFLFYKDVDDSVSSASALITCISGFSIFIVTFLGIILDHLRNLFDITLLPWIYLAIAIPFLISMEAQAKGGLRRARTLRVIKQLPSEYRDRFWRVTLDYAGWKAPKER